MAPRAAAPGSPVLLTPTNSTLGRSASGRRLSRLGSGSRRRLSRGASGSSCDGSSDGASMEAAPEQLSGQAYVSAVPDKNVPGSIWEAIGAALREEAPALDLAPLEESFALAKAAQAEPSTPKNTVNAVIDLRRATNVGITLRGCQITPKNVVSSVTARSGPAFESPDLLRGLIPCIPTEDERASLEAYARKGGALSSLSATEQVMAALAGIPRLAQRLRACQLDLELPEKLAHAQDLLKVSFSLLPR
ncbi:hypothetical protein MNEG_11694 [Monoraphidium neglectum]|uniref:FH2 domain-containing protein n=1 Tax=Monoraphidium neglectum TaxID=145388 RepID=A0A0D2LXY5_9CHLO|nr:hypothetical protein MNEG_11694 [Monoraphidium neglectum]KIY96269.1 hypothetical protein MNEG_11694 [Monoraphidium neglectum]|eukprot:XP_013895289.1 hypothetical protein MNEG_11694 [Monoraphidium neglectum]